MNLLNGSGPSFALDINLPAVEIGLRVERIFFDRLKVIEGMHGAEIRVLSRFGAFVRRTARTSIRRTKRAVSRPGEPPRSHSAEPNLRTIFFAYEPERHRVVIGPVLLNGRAGTVVRGIVPKTLELGGDLTVIEKKVGKRWIQTASRLRWNAESRTRTIHIRARPFMQPAFERELPGFPDLWQNSLGRRAA